MKKFTPLLFFVGFLISISIGLIVTPWLFESSGLSLYKYVVRTVLLMVSLYLLWKALIEASRPMESEGLKNMLVIACSVFTILIVVEIVFTFLPMSSGGQNNLVAKNWVNFYWRENRLGYRDGEVEEIDEGTKKNLFVIGDSYVAGHGLNAADERFADLMQQKYDNCIDVFNLAKPGADTRDEFSFLTSYPVKPDFLVVAHVNNDIYNVVEKRELMNILHLDASFKSFVKSKKSNDGFLSTHSFAVSFLGYLIVEKQRDMLLASIAGKYSTFEEFLDSEQGRAVEMCYYKNDSLLNLQLRNIDKFINYAKENKVPLLFVLFPKMDDAIIDFTDRTANQVLVKYLSSKGVPAVNVTPELKSLSEKQRMVSKFDPHPSPAANKLVAKAIDRFLNNSGLIHKVCNTARN